MSKYALDLIDKDNPKTIKNNIKLLLYKKVFEECMVNPGKTDLDYSWQIYRLVNAKEFIGIREKFYKVIGKYTVDTDEDYLAISQNQEINKTIYVIESRPEIQHLINYLRK